MSATVVFFIVAATSLVMAVGAWIVKDTQPKKSDIVKNIMSAIIVLLFAVTAGSAAFATASIHNNVQKSRHNCVNVDDGYVVTFNGTDYCFEEPPKLIGKI